jgi:hypothetical protein
MKNTAASIFALMFVVLVSAPGCGSGRRTTGGDSGTPRMDSGIPTFADTGVMPGHDGGPPHDAGVDSGAPPRDSGRDTGRMCATSCSSDSQCSSTCPSMPSRASCCDLGTNTCYTATTSVCPAGGDDGGTTMMY